MLQLKTCLTLTALLVGGLLGSCSGNSGRDTTTTTPTSMLGTDSAATKVGGMPADTTGTGAVPGKSQ